MNKALRSSLPALALVALTVAGCGAGGGTTMTMQPLLAPTTSSTIALASDDSALWVVNPDADSISLIDPVARTLTVEILLGAAHPAVDPTTQRYEPSKKPRALAILPGDKKVYVACQSANAVYVVDAATRSAGNPITVGAAPTGIVATPDGSAVYVVNHESATVSKIDPKTDQVVATLPVAEHPWGASVSADGKTLYVTHLLLHAGVTLVDTASFTVRSSVELAEQAPDPASFQLPNGVARGVYTAVPRPSAILDGGTESGGGELWMPHLLLAIQTAEPTLNFQTTVFPTVSTLDADGHAEGKRLLFRPPMVPNATGSFTQVVSGPRALAFTPDGKHALMANSGSEDVMVFSADSGDAEIVLSPLPATFLEGIAVDHAGKFAWLDGRNSHNVVALSIAEADPINLIAVDGDPIDRLTADPMPSNLRLGQRMFYTANSSVYPVTQNRWMSCSTCHLEGGTDAVTWQFKAGPRDTPSNAGGPINTGFLLRQALRNSVLQYDLTINVEQGGNFDHNNAVQGPLMQELADFVNYAIPYPQNPNLGPTLTDAQKHGQGLFNSYCAGCHTGAYYTDSGANNPTLDMNGPFMLHDIGTCVKSGHYPDNAEPDDVIGKMHTACDFDTPSLRGVFATAPYFHDGSAATLDDAVSRLFTFFSLPSSGTDQSDLVEFLKTL